MKLSLLCILCISTLPVSAAEITGRFAPPAGKVLIFSGQDNISVGGTEKYSDGYVNNVDIPAGITHYVYFPKDGQMTLGEHSQRALWLA